MKNILSTLTLIVTCLIAPTIAHSQEGNKMSDDQKKVLTTIEKMTEAFHAGDIKGVMKSYENTATIVFEPEMAVSDPAIIRKMFQGFFAANPHFTYSGHEVFIAGDIAVLRKQADGNWLMVIDNPHGQYLMPDK